MGNTEEGERAKKNIARLRREKSITNDSITTLKASIMKDCEDLGYKENEQKINTIFEAIYDGNIKIHVDDHYNSIVDSVDNMFSGNEIEKNTAQKSYDALFNQYVLGGVEILYEEIFEKNKPKTADDYLRNLYDFLEDYHERCYHNLEFEER